MATISNTDLTKLSLADLKILAEETGYGSDDWVSSKFNKVSKEPLGKASVLYDLFFDDPAELSGPPDHGIIFVFIDYNGKLAVEF